MRLRYTRLRLCSPVRPAIIALVGVAAYLLGRYAVTLLTTLYERLLGVGTPVELTSLLGAALVGLVASVAGYTARSPLTAALLALAVLQFSQPVTPQGASLAAAIPLAVVAALALLLGGPLEAVHPKLGASPLRASLAATSAYVASHLCPSCNWFWAVGTLLSGAAAIAIEGPAGLAAGILAGLGWLGLLAGIVVEIFKPRRPPLCGGLRGEVEGILTRAPISQMLEGARGRWSALGFACARGTGTLLPLGERGAVVEAYGPRAREAGEALASLKGDPLVLCIACDEDYWLSRGYQRVAVKPAATVPSQVPPRTILVAEAEKPWEYSLTLITMLEEVESRYPSVIVDRSDLVEGPRALSAIADSLLDKTELVILIHPDPLRPPITLSVPGAHSAVVVSGQVPLHSLERLLPLPAPEAVEHAYHLLEAGYSLVYPSCEGSVVAFRKTPPGSS
ncbi:MAG: hypothetical protein LRS46_03070 [Desulfurococcales archaeon]|nr:hypothetical protein [Desulfurococcales archaeon]